MVDQLEPSRIYEIKLDEKLRSKNGQSMSDLNAPAKIHYTLKLSQTPRDQTSCNPFSKDDKIDVAIGGKFFATIISVSFPAHYFGYMDPIHPHASRLPF